MVESRLGIRVVLRLSRLGRCLGRCLGQCLFGHNMSLLIHQPESPSCLFSRDLGNDLIRLRSQHLGIST